ncbi:MAG: hypothetical protein OHK0011_00230 [Turneriella sp.]
MSNNNNSGSAGQNQKEKMHAPGSFVLALIFLAWFMVVYFTQWLALSKNWTVY